MSRALAASRLHITSTPPDTRSKEDRRSRRASRRAGSAAAQNNTTALFSGDHERPSAEVLNGIGSDNTDNTSGSSAPSLASTPNNKMSYPGHTASISALTPVTSTDSSPPGKTSSPRSAKPSHDTQPQPQPTRRSPRHTPSALSNSMDTSTLTPAHTPPEVDMGSARPTDGRMGSRCVYDPQLDPNKAARRSAKPVYKDIIEKGDLIPPPDPRLAIAGYTSGVYDMPLKSAHKTVHKHKCRPAPYMPKPYSFDARISCGPDPAVQIVATGFDPLTPESQIRAFFSSFGDVESLKNQVHPDNGSPLGICLVRYRDTPGSKRVPAIPASTSAKRALKEGSGQRIGLREVKVQLDREGFKCNKFVSQIVNKSRAEQEKLRAKMARTAKPTPAIPVAPAKDLPANVPKGPSGKGNGMRPPIQPVHPVHVPGPPVTRSRHSSIIETVPIKPQLKRTPYLFLAHQFVPVLGATVEHLKKRLKSFRWTAVRCDRTGYYVTFENSKWGEIEAVKCYNHVHMAALFTYTMNMECNQFGDPDYERSPSPERVAAINKRKAEEDKIAQEEADDFELEKKERADNLDPVVAAIEILKQEFQEKALSDIKTRISGPALLKLMAPERHAAKRRKLNIPDPPTKEEQRVPTLLVPEIGQPAPAANKRSLQRQLGRKALGPYDSNRQRGRNAQPVNVYGDERRKTAAPKRNNVRGLHHALLMAREDDKEESDDETRSAFTRDTEEQESRPISRAPSSELDEEESSRAHRAKRRRIEAGWGEDSDDEMMDDSHARSLLAHLIHKDPENMAEKELEQVLAILPRSSPIWKKADKALKGFRKLRIIQQEADEIFGAEPQPVEDKPEPMVIVTQEEEAIKPVPTTEVEPSKPKKKPTVSKKRKTKKQLQEEAEAAEAEAKLVEAQIAEELTRAISEQPEDASQDITPAPEQPVPEVVQPEEDERASVFYGVSTTEPRRIVEDDPSVVMDIDGWQHLVKDDEDLRYLKEALADVPAARIGDAQTWAWRQKQIKHLNRPGEEGVCRTETKIEGYYVPNSTGSARTEGVKKIRESEKSKYLPHRIKVQKQREERELRAKNEDPGRTTTVVEGFKFTTGTKTTSTANSRANRANNRRLVNDINISKTMTGAEGDAMRFNQLKKRKKLVKFDRSAIHNWGLYAQENISANDMIIEYVGEKVRQRVADMREARYDLQGVGSSYLFRIDEDTVIDATKMGGIARFINHSCTPNCTAKIIRVDGTKRIVIYALRDINQDEELTYDYKFEREMDATDRIPCLCGSVGCKGFLN